MKIINCHTHVFTNRHTPDRMLFLPGFVHFLSINSVGRKFTRSLAPILHKIDPKSDHDLMSRLARYATTGNAKTQEEIFEQIERHYPSISKFIILPMDFDQMKAGKCKKHYSYLHQIKELAKIYHKKEYKNKILPFVFADPRRNNILDHVKHYINKEKFFKWRN